MKRVGIISVFFGPWPGWFPFTLQSFSYNDQFEWLVFSDQEKPEFTPGNAIFYHLEKNDFIGLVKEKTSLDSGFTDPYKLCDFKPLYGKIFEDYTVKYDFWGYADLDIIYGNLSSVISNETLMENDIINGYQSFLSGPFCLYRNNEEIRTLFQNIADYESILKDPVYLGMDENITRGKTPWNRFWDWRYAFPYIIRERWRPVDEMKYQFQWYLKKRQLDRHHLKDMTEVALSGLHEGVLNMVSLPLIYSDRYFKRMGQGSWHLRWDREGLTETVKKQKIPLFHFVDAKRGSQFRSVKFDRHLQSFSISDHGIDYAQ
jgi:hypothetical protein